MFQVAGKRGGGGERERERERRERERERERTETETYRDRDRRTERDTRTKTDSITFDVFRIFMQYNEIIEMKLYSPWISSQSMNVNE